MPIMGSRRIPQGSFPTMEDILRGGWEFDPTLNITGRVSPELEATIPDPVAPPAPQQSGGGGGFGKGLLKFLGGFAGHLGDNLTDSTVYADAMKERRKLESEQQLLKPVYAAIDANPNMTPQEKALAKAYPKPFIEQWSQQFGTRVVNKGDTVQRGLGGGRSDTYMAPEVHGVGKELILTDPQHRLGPPRGPGSPILPGGLDLPPAPGMASPIYRGRSDAETYAGAFGQPGNPDYLAALKDFQLKEYGPSAVGVKRELQSGNLASQERRAAMADKRQRELHTLPQPNEAAVIGRLTAKDAAGKPLSPAERRVLDDYRTRHTPGRGGFRSGGGGGAPEGSTIRNPRTGQTAVKRGGAWVDQRTGRPVAELAGQ